jgi:uncharacterized protein
MASIVTPCIRTCVLHPTGRLCVGCGRTLDEIAHWIVLSDEERRRIMEQLPSRLAALSGTNAGMTTAPADAAPRSA